MIDRAIGVLAHRWRHEPRLMDGLIAMSAEPGHAGSAPSAGCPSSHSCGRRQRAGIEHLALFTGKQVCSLLEHVYYRAGK